MKKYLSLLASKCNPYLKRNKQTNLKFLCRDFNLLCSLREKNAFHFQLRKHIVPAVVKASKRRDEETKGMLVGHRTRPIRHEYIKFVVEVANEQSLTYRLVDTVEGP